MQGETEQLAYLAKLNDQLESQLQRTIEVVKGSQIPMTVQFRTGSAEIEHHFANQLDGLAKVLNRLPDMQVDLAGFADTRGDKTFNLELSQQRVERVKQYLISQGISIERLHSQAFGDLHPLAKENDFEGNFFDRRVMLKTRDKNVAVASHF